MRNKTQVIIIFTPLLFFLLSISLTGNAGSRKNITVAGITDKVPVEYNSGKGSNEGIYVELWKIWSKKSGVAVNYIIAAPEDAEKLLTDGTVDVIMGYHLIDSRSNFKLSEEIYKPGIYIYYNTRIESAENLAGLAPHRVGVTVHEIEELHKLKSDIDFIEKKSTRELIDASERGEINVFLAEAALANHNLRELRLWGNYTQSAEPVFTHAVYAAVRGEDKELLQLINTGFKGMTGTEILFAERTWAGGNFRYSIPWIFISTIFVILSVIAGVAVVWWWNYQLHKKIKKSTAELTILKEAAEEANLAKSRFLDNISHELRTPLTLIISPIEESIKGKPIDKTTLEMIQWNSRHLLSLINDLLYISRLTTGKITPDSGIEHLSDRAEVRFSENGPDKLHIPLTREIKPYTAVEFPSTTPDMIRNSSDDLPAILIVEDNKIVQNFLKDLLNTTYVIYTASNGIEALEILNRAESVDLIVSDIMMPKMDGHELLKNIQSDERLEGIPVIFLTASGDDMMKHEGLKLGAVDYVTKPFNSDELKLRIKKQIDLRIIQNKLQRKNDELYEKLKQHIVNRKIPVSDDIKKKIETICDFIKEHFADDITRDNLASAADMNPDTFSRMFNQYTGVTLPDYISELRISKAKIRLAETDDKITRICMDTGFDSIRTFNRAFRKHTGKTPGEFRETLKGF